MATNRTNREFVMLSTVLDKAKHRIGGMFVSEKLDGMRAIWIPAARGRPVDTLPFANIEKDKKVSLATGLFSRYGKIIYAPASFLDALPTDRCLDGELWIGRQSFEETMSIVKKHEPNELDWMRVKYLIFDSPGYSEIFKDGRINNPNFKKLINFNSSVAVLGGPVAPTLGFEFTLRLLEKESTRHGDELWFHDKPNILVAHQELLPFKTDSALNRLEELFTEITDDGGEGLMLRHPSWSWEPYRSHFLCKYKPDKDDEGSIVGYIAGKGKHEGRLGSIRLLYNDLQFDVGGFTDKERELYPAFTEWANRNPGAFTTDPVSFRFPLGSIVNFTYRELTNAGIPKEARFKRVRPHE